MLKKEKESVMNIDKNSAYVGYPFKRNFYYDIEKAMDKSNVVF